MSETTKCPKCGKLMLLVPSGIEFLTYPGKSGRKWQCGCGHSEPAPSVTHRLPHAKFMDDWRRVNGM